VAFFPFLALVISTWLYAFHLDRLANQSMVRSKELNPLKNTPKLDPLSSSEQDSVVIGDSQDNIFYFIQVTLFVPLSLCFATSLLLWLTFICSRMYLFLQLDWETNKFYLACDRCPRYDPDLTFLSSLPCF
jgi:hypothetical protein